MKKFKLCLVLFLSWSLISNISAQASWKLISSDAQIMSGTPFKLQAIKGGSHLCYEKRKFGINLSWGVKEPYSIFKLFKKGDGPIKCGDKVALFNDYSGFIKYGSQKWGINLVTSDEPAYEWEIRNEENKQGSPINANTPIGLYNSRANDFIRKCTRSGSPTVDLAWVLDCPNGYRLPGPLANTSYNNMTRDQVVKYLIKVAIESL